MMHHMEQEKTGHDLCRGSCAMRGWIRVGLALRNNIEMNENSHDFVSFPRDLEWLDILEDLYILGGLYFGKRNQPISAL